MKKQNGITLIALVVTIIILLILAGVALKIIAGGDGIIGKTEKAVSKTNDAVIIEDVEMKVAEELTQYCLKEQREPSIGEYLVENNPEEGYEGRDCAQIYFDNAEDKIIPITYIDKKGNKTYLTMKLDGSNVKIVGRENFDETIIGEYVDLETEWLEKKVTLSDGNTPKTDWRIFSQEGDKVWLIMSDYLPFEKEKTLQTGLVQYSTSYPYNWISKTNRDDLIGRLKGEINDHAWDKLLDKTSLDTDETEGAVKLKPRVSVVGALEIEKWIKGWNAVEGTHLVITKNDIGYLISKKESGEATDYAVDNLDKVNTLFFPHNKTISEASGYWLVSPSALGGKVMVVGYNGYVGGTGYDYNCQYRCIRPVVCLPYNLLIEGEDGVWKLVK